jgi:hypothetical protein
VLSGELAFRVHFEGPAPAAEGLYWRGPVLWQTDGRRWSPGPGLAPVGPPGELLETARLIDYEVTLEPTDQRWWFALDLPVSTPEGARMSADHQLIALQTASTAQRYRVRSALEYRTGPLDR